jgi:diacylglycerol kinase (ATP)
MDGDHLSAGSRHRVALVINPTSGVGRAARAADAVSRRLSERADVEVLCGASEADSLRLLRLAVGRHDAVAVLGGDGTVHLAVQVLAETGTPLGIIPAGTGNDVADVLGLPCDPLTAADALLAALDAGSMRALDLGRTGAGRWWATILCAGFDSAVNERANRMRWPRGPHRYDLAIAVELARLRHRPFTVDLDGTRLDAPATLVAVGNTPQYGGGKLMTPDARVDDGMFAVTIVAPVSRRTLARMAPTLGRAGHIGHPAVSTYRARTVTLDAPDTLAYADGERIGSLPVTVSCVPGALYVLTPP